MAINPIVVATVAGVEVASTEPGVPYWDSAGDGEDGYEGPDFMTEAHDVAILNGYKVPGVTRVKCGGKKKIDVPKATGRDGGPTHDRGHEAARLEITITLWTPSQWEIWQAIAKKLWRPPGAPVAEGDMKAITIVHPNCSPPPLSVSAIWIETMESADWSAEKGAIIRMKAVQYIPQKASDVARTVKGAGVPVAKEITQAKNAAPEKPSKTDAVPVLPAAPSRGSH